MKYQRGQMTTGGIAACIMTGLLFTAFLFWVFPVWNVWAEELSGKAMLKKAEQEKLIMIETAKAEKDSAVYRAAAIETIGKMAQKYPEYRQQEFLGAVGEALIEGNINQILYIPTEAMMPITEAGKRTDYYNPTQ